MTAVRVALFDAGSKAHSAAKDRRTAKALRRQIIVLFMATGMLVAGGLTNIAAGELSFAAGNGAKAFQHEVSKALQHSLIQSLGLRYIPSRVIHREEQAIAAVNELPGGNPQGPLQREPP